MPQAFFSHLAICLPAHNEKTNLLSLVPEIDRKLGDLGVPRTSILVFDDGSTDGTEDALQSLVVSQAELILIRSLVRVGKSQALHHMISTALENDADALVMMDADGQDDPVYLLEILNSLKLGSDVVNGRRTNRAHPLLKKISSRAFNASLRFITGYKIFDVNSGLKGFSRTGARVLLPFFYGELHRVILVIARTIGLRVGEVMVTNRERFSGRSKYGVGRSWRGLFDLVTVELLRRYHSRPGHFLSGAGSLLLIAGFVLAMLGTFGLFADGLLSTWVLVGTFAVGFGLVTIGLGFLSELTLFLSKNPVTSAVTTVTMSPSQESTRSGNWLH